MEVIAGSLRPRQGADGVRDALLGFLLAGEDFLLGRTDGLLAGPQVLLGGAQSGEVDPVALLRGQAILSGTFVPHGIRLIRAEPLARAADRPAKMPDT
ncbi:hypothetical protein AB4212_50740, partial [Streptomyces sp. 2MCAF27]